MTYETYDPTTLCERLRAGPVNTGLLDEAVARIQELEKLCAMMTDTGVILEEDAAELSKADIWWVPGDGECSYTSLQEAMHDDMLGYEDLQIAGWERGHFLADSYAVKFPEIRDYSGRVKAQAVVREFTTYEDAEQAVVEHRMAARKAERA